MAILNYTTKIDHFKSIGEIQEKLSKCGAQQIVINFNSDGLPAGINFSVLWDNSIVYFKLPCNFKGVLRAMETKKKIPRSLCTEEQALRVGWRIVKDWVEAQLAIVEADVVKMPEAFLQYALTNKGETLYTMVENNKKMLALPPGN